MITSIAQVTVLVHDYDEAKNFYCDKLGFSCVEDTQLGPDKRWIRIKASAANAGSEILLVKANSDAEQALVGRQSGGRVLLFLNTDDLASDFRDLKEKGVIFVQDPIARPHGKVAVFEDLYGNRMDLIEPLRGL